MPSYRPALLLPGLAAVAVLAGCAEDAAPVGSTGSVAVTATDSACEVGRTDLEAGATTFSIHNGGDKVTEVYVYEGDRIVTEKENIGPGTSYDLTVQLDPGSYEVACKPGMTGDGIRTTITVGEATSGAAGASDPRGERAVAAYRAWVQTQADALVPVVGEFAAAVKGGDADRARELYAPSRVPWERIEPVAESFGDLDPRVDLREADLAQGQTWTGWHRIEKALWAERDLSGMAKVADRLVADVAELQDRVADADMTVASIGNGAKELIDEVATGKVTGEEEAFSHTDLVDFDANVDGAHKAFAVLRPMVEASDPQLATTLDAAFADVRATLDQYRSGDGFVTYDTVGEKDRRELARVVDALGEPLSRLAATAVA